MWQKYTQSSFFAKLFVEYAELFGFTSFAENSEVPRLVIRRDFNTLGYLSDNCKQKIPIKVGIILCT